MTIIAVVHVCQIQSDFTICIECDIILMVMVMANEMVMMNEMVMVVLVL